MGARQVYFDDLDNTEADVETIGFALHGATYEIDLSAENKAKLEELLAPYIDAGRRLGAPTRNQRPRKPRAQRVVADDTSDGAIETERVIIPDFDTKAARKWLRDNNHDVPARGKLGADIVAPYLASEEFKATQDV